MFTSLLNLTATVTRKTFGQADDYGNPVESWDAVYADIPCRLSERPIGEDEVDRETVTRGATLFCEGDVVLTPYDRVTVADGQWEVVGQPQVRYGRAAAHHVEVELRAVVI